jgi:hypothetical protein
MLRLSHSNISVLQLNSRGLHPEQIYAMLPHMCREVERKEQEVERAKREVERAKQQLERKEQEVERAKQQLAGASCCAFFQEQRGAREGKKANGCSREQERAKEGKKLDRTLYILVSAPLLFFLKWWDLFGDG